MGTSMEQRRLEVIIVGGSIAGLMHGVVLKHLGHNVRILERSPSDLLHDQGAGVIAMEKVLELLSKHDLSKQPHFVPSAQIQFLDRAASTVKTWKVPLSMTSWNTLYYRLRANFDGLPSPYVPQTEDLHGEKDGNVKYQHGITVTGVQCNDDIVTVSFQETNGQTGKLQADLVIAADGPSSKIRKLLHPAISRNYVGYVAWRGTVPEHEVSKKTKQVFQQNLTYFVYKGATILLYMIPGKNGTVEAEERLLNWVWYCNYGKGSPGYTDVMTDNDGHQHRITVPIGKVRDELWTQQKAFAKQIMPAPFKELIEKTKQPFIQAITDADIVRPCQFGGKLLIVGDALSTFRPHVGSSTNQAALNALLLEKAVTGEITLKQWEQECLDYARVTSLTSVAWGNKNQFGFWVFAWSAVCLLWARLSVILQAPKSILPTFGL